MQIWLSYGYMGVALIIVQNRRWHCRCLKHVWKRYSIMHLKTLQIFLFLEMNGTLKMHISRWMWLQHLHRKRLLPGFGIRPVWVASTKHQTPYAVGQVPSPDRVSPDRSFSLFRCFCKPWIPLQQRREKRQRHTASLWLKTLLLKT